MKHRLRLTILFAAFCLTLTTALPATIAQDAAPPLGQAEISDPAATLFGSPRATMFTFLKAIREAHNGNDNAWPNVYNALDYSSVEPLPAYQKQILARDLWESLNRIRLILPEELPGRDDLADGTRAHLFFPRVFSPEDRALADEIEANRFQIVLARNSDGHWRFSTDTVAGVSDFYTKIRRRAEKVRKDKIDADEWVRPFVPNKLKEHQFLDVEAWQWLALLALIILAVACESVVRYLGRPLLTLGAKKMNVREDQISAQPAKPLGLFLGSLIFIVLVPLLDLTPPVETVLLAAARLFATLTLVWASWRLTDTLATFLGAKAENTDTRFDDILVPLIRKALKIFVVAFGIIFAADALNIPIGPMLASLGIGGVAFAFAAKDTVENFFGSIAVLLDRPFDVGDWVIIDGSEGTVEEVGFRSTRIRTFYNSQITVPNSNLVRATVDNYGRRQYRRWKCHLGVQYDTTPDQLIAFTEGIRELIRTHPYTRKDYYQVWCHEFADSSLNILLYMFFEVPDWNTELRERERLFIDIVRLADQLGVSFAFPTQTVHLYKEEQRPYESQHNKPTSMTDRRAMVSGIQAAQNIIENQAWQSDKPGPMTYGQIGPTSIKLDEHGNAVLDKPGADPQP